MQHPVGTPGHWEGGLTELILTPWSLPGGAADKGADRNCFVKKLLNDLPVGKGHPRFSWMKNVGHPSMFLSPSRKSIKNILR